MVEDWLLGVNFDMISVCEVLDLVYELCGLLGF